MIFEGAQGVLLDQNHGFHPHTTWSDCTPSGALELLEGIDCPIRRLAVTRAYSVRHGPGPFPTHLPAMDRDLDEPHNDDRGWQGAFRRGALDLVALRYGLAAAGGADGLAISFLDRVGDSFAVCDGYELDGILTDRLPHPGAGDLEALEDLGHEVRLARPRMKPVDRRDLRSTIEEGLGVPVWIEASGPTNEDRQWVGDAHQFGIGGISPGRHDW